MNKKNIMKKLLKILNPFIWFINQFSHQAHLFHWAELENCRKERGVNKKPYEYEPYDFSKDIKYF